MKKKLHKALIMLPIVLPVALALFWLGYKWFWWHTNLMLDLGAQIEAGDNRTDNY